MNRSPPPHKIDSFFILYFLSNRVRAKTRTHPPFGAWRRRGSFYADFWVDIAKKRQGGKKALTIGARCGILYL